MSLPVFSDTWYQVLSYLDLIELNTICYVNKHLRNVAIHTLAKTPYASEFLSFIYSFLSMRLLFETNNKVFSTFLNFNERISRFLPLVHQLAAKNSHKAEQLMDHLHFQMVPSNNVPMELTSMVCPFAKEMFYQQYKSEKIIRINTDHTQFMPALEGLIKALRSPSSNIEHLSFSIDCSVASLMVSLLSRFFSQDQSIERSNLLSDQIKWGLPFYVDKKGKNQIKKELLSLSMEHSNSGSNGVGIGIMNVGSFCRTVRPKRNENSAFGGGTFRRGQQDSMNSSGFESSAFGGNLLNMGTDPRESSFGDTQMNFNNDNNHNLNNAPDSEVSSSFSNLSEFFPSKSIYDLNLEDISEKANYEGTENQDDKNDSGNNTNDEKLIIGDYLNNPVKAERYWIQKLFNLLKKFNCDLLDAISANECGIKKISGVFSHLFKDIVENSKHKDIEYCAITDGSINPSNDIENNDPYNKMLLESIVSLPIHALVMKDSLAQTIHKSLPYKTLGTNLNHIVLSYPALAEFIDSFANLKHLTKITIICNFDVRPRGVDFTRFSNLETISIKKNVHQSILEEIGAAPIRTLELDAESDVSIGVFFNKRFECGHGPLQKLLYVPQGAVKRLDNSFAEFCKKIDKAPLEVLELSGYPQEYSIHDIMLTWGGESSSDDPILFKHLIVHHEVSFTSLARLLSITPQLETVTCDYVSDLHLGLSHLPFILQKYKTDLKEIKMNLIFPDSNDIQSFLYTMKSKANFITSRFNIQSSPPVLSSPFGREADMFAKTIKTRSSLSSNSQNRLRTQESLPSNNILNEVCNYIYNGAWSLAIRYVEDRLDQIRDDDIERIMLKEPLLSGRQPMQPIL
eukprot:gb/GECH01009148.1/.p1 GENE.gb/GECH01009148.1/~~gb/GECH01009148.1/.p1  ORF type:complete len:853 (+),score=146.39 gb/GECH01009148.1/:1-2559(+)